MSLPNLLRIALCLCSSIAIQLDAQAQQDKCTIKFLCGNPSYELILDTTQIQYRTTLNLLAPGSDFGSKALSTTPAAPDLFVHGQSGNISITYQLPQPAIPLDYLQLIAVAEDGIGELSLPKHRFFRASKDSIFYDGGRDNGHLFYFNDSLTFTMLSVRHQVKKNGRLLNGNHFLLVEDLELNKRGKIRKMEKWWNYKNGWYTTGKAIGALSTLTGIGLMIQAENTYQEAMNRYENHYQPQDDRATAEPRYAGIKRDIEGSNKNRERGIYFLVGGLSTLTASWLAHHCRMKRREKFWCRLLVLPEVQRIPHPLAPTGSVGLKMITPF